MTWQFNNDDALVLQCNGDGKMTQEVDTAMVQGRRCDCPIRSFVAPLLSRHRNIALSIICTCLLTKKKTTANYIGIFVTNQASRCLFEMR